MTGARVPTSPVDLSENVLSNMCDMGVLVLLLCGDIDFEYEAVLKRGGRYQRILLLLSAVWR